MEGFALEGKKLHVALATQAGAFGGHLEPGSIACVLCELLLLELGDGHLARKEIEVEHARTGELMRALRLSVE